MVQWVGHGSFKRLVPSFQRACLIPGRIRVVSGRASDLECSCATLVQVRRPLLILEIKKKLCNIKVSHKVSQGIETINECEIVTQRS